MSTPGEILEALGREARSLLGNGRDTTTRVYRGRSVEELVPQFSAISVPTRSSCVAARG